MVSAVSIHHPSALLLKRAVEGVFLVNQSKLTCPRTSLKTPNDFEALSEEMNHRLSGDSLRRIWGYKKSYNTARLASLDFLAIYAGYKGWNDFVERTSEERKVESVLDNSGFDLCSDCLECGAVVTLSWMPDRICSLKYLGNNKYEVVSAQNSQTLSAGDTLCFRTIKVGEPLMADNVVHSGVAYAQVILGKQNGIASVRVEK